MVLGGFAVLMLFISVRMARKAVRDPRGAAIVRADTRIPVDHDNGAYCPWTPDGRVRITRRCGITLALAGLGTGLLSGLVGVGGGFVIVPSLSAFTRMSAHRAVATSLLVIATISAAGLASFLLGGGSLPLGTTAVFVAGGLCGMALGTALAVRLSPVALQKVFAAVVAIVAIFVIVKNLVGPAPTQPHDGAASTSR